LSAFSEEFGAVSSDQPGIEIHSPRVDRLVRLLQGETVVLGGAFDVSQAIAELKLRGFDAAVGLKETGAFRLSLGSEFVRGCFRDAILRVNGKEVAVSETGLLLLRRSEVTLDETPALDELISLLRLERVVPRDVSALREVANTVGLEWAIDFDCVGATPASDPDLAYLFELEAAVSSDDPLDALSKAASFRAGDWQSVIDALFRFTSAKPLRWRETSHALREILQKFPESVKCLEGQGKVSVGEQLLWLSIDDFDRGSVAGSLDPRRPSFVLAWREFHGRCCCPLLAALAGDDVEGLRSSLFLPGLRVVSAGGDIFASSTGDGRQLSILALATQFGAVRCTKFLLTSGAKAGASEVAAASRGGDVELMRMLWEAFPDANPLEAALEAVKSWNLAGLRWLLDTKIDALSPNDLVRLFKGACSSGSYSCASSVMDFSASAEAHLRLQRPVGLVGRVLCGGLGSLKMGVSFIPEDSMGAAYSEEVYEWLGEATEIELVAQHKGRDAASVNAFVDAAEGRAKTLTFVETENGGSICGGYLDVAWDDGGYVSDPGRRSFIFTLKNHVGVPPTKFAQTRCEYAAYMSRDNGFYFGSAEGFRVWQSDYPLNYGQTYKAPDQGVSLFCGGASGMFRAARWELWQIR
jgi:hypothetical protein